MIISKSGNEEELSMKNYDSGRISSEVIRSWERCIQKRVTVDKLSPKRIKGNLEDIIERDRDLIKIFTQSAIKITNYICSPYLFILTDPHGYLLEYVCSKEPEGELQENNITRGVSFKEDSLGTNAIALSIILQNPVYLSQEQHFCEYFKKWFCFAVPLKYKNKIIAFLDVSTIEIKLKGELKAILCLLAENIINELEKRSRTGSIDLQEGLSLRQIKVLKLLARGMTEKEVADKLKMSINTVKYHKQRIYRYLGARCISEALIKAVKKDILIPEDF